MNEELSKKLPFSLNAEQALLGSILIDPESFNEIANLVSPEDFYITEHKQIYSAMHELFVNSHEIDVVTLIDELVKQGVYNKSGGEEYIRTVSESVPNAMNVRDYAKIVREKSVLRGLIAACGEISDAAYSETQGAAEILEAAEQRLYDLAQGRDSRDFRSIRELLNAVYAQLHALKTEKEAVQGVMTGFTGLDRVLAGLGKSDLVLIGARPGMGKTSFALNIGTNAAEKTGKAVCIFSLEMSAEQLVTRIIASEAMVDSYALRTGELNDQDWHNIASAASKLIGCNILIDDTAGITVTGMKAKLRKVKNLGMVIIDYLQLMQSDKRIDNRVQEISEISRSLKLLAKELMVPVICCAQLSRGPESRENKRPMLSDLRDSGAIEQDADSVLFLYRDEYYKTSDAAGGEEENNGNIAEVIIAKNRHGSCGTVKMGWIGRYTKFRTIADEHETGGAANG